MTLLLAQEFDLPDVLRLWDSLLSDSRRFLQVAAYLLPYYSLTTRYSPPTTHYSLLTTHYPTPTTQHPRPDTRHRHPLYLHYTYCPPLYLLPPL